MFRFHFLLLILLSITLSGKASAEDPVDLPDPPAPVPESARPLSPDDSSKSPTYYDDEYHPPANPGVSAPSAGEQAPRLGITETDLPPPSSFDFALDAGTDFPLWAGGGGEFILWQHLSVGGGYGTLPHSYASFIGQIAADLGKDGSYKTLLQDVLQSNSAPRVQLDYRAGEFGWNVGFAAYFVSASGQSSVQDTLQLINGVNLSYLNALLAQYGSNALLSAKTDMTIGEFHFGYTWQLIGHLGFQSDLGVAKVLGSSASLTSNNSQINSNTLVQGLYSSAEQQVQSILSSYGITPVLSLSLRYTF